MGYLTTHVLDTARGRPGHGIRLELYRLDGESRTRLTEAVTNADGRCDVPLLQGDAFTEGEYELLFHVGDYLGEPVSGVFLERVPLRFRVASADEHYHVPLLLSTYGYTTYRGS